MQFTTICVGVVAIVWSALAGAQPELKPSQQWIDRPWEYRYLLRVDEKSGWKFAEKRWQEGEREDVRAYFPPAHVLKTEPEFIVSRATGERFQMGDGAHLGVMRLDVSLDRQVLTPNIRGASLEARLNDIYNIVLAPKGETPASFQIRLGEFFMGAPWAQDSAYSPSICQQKDMYSPSEKYAELGRYNKGYNAATAGYFGCREWAAQLYDKQRPYIDVTSYEISPDYSKEERNGKYPLAPQTYIHPFIGFSRFDDAPKPVIGNHKGRWFCITDCPAGDAPGEIPDIKAWAARSGWAVPQKPKNVRAYMNKPYKRGDFID
jgi:hypothetical protein